MKNDGDDDDDDDDDDDIVMCGQMLLHIVISCCTSFARRSSYTVFYEYVCVSVCVCLSVRISPEPCAMTAIFTKFLCMLPMAVAWSSSSGAI